MALAMMMPVLPLGGETKNDPPLRLIFKLDDGSRIIGTTKRETIPFQSSLASIDVSLREIRAIEFKKDGPERVLVTFRNGDRLKGSIKLEEVELETLFGRVSIGMGHIRSLNVESRRGASMITDGLIGLWHLDGSAEDSSGHDRHGEVNGAVSVDDGRFGGAYHFDGKAGINVGHVDFSMGSFTVSGWIRTKAPAVVEDWKTWIDDVDDGGGSFMLGLCDGRRDQGRNGPQYATWDRGIGLLNIGIGNTKLNLRDGEWHMVTATYRKGSQKMYVDGVLFQSDEYSGKLPVHDTDVIIGGRDFGPYHHPWVGDVDEVSIYDRELSSSEIEELYSTRR